jgi:hypothetical protein
VLLPMRKGSSLAESVARNRWSTVPAVRAAATCCWRTPDSRWSDPGNLSTGEPPTGTEAPGASAGCPICSCCTTGRLRPHRRFGGRHHRRPWRRAPALARIRSARDQLGATWRVRCWRAGPAEEHDSASRRELTRFVHIGDLENLGNV